MEDFSTPYAFWLFSFERCNGYLGSFNNNHRNVELTFMKRFWEASRLKINSTNMFNKIVESSASSSNSISLLNGFKDYMDEHIFDPDSHLSRVRKQEEDGYDSIKMLDYSSSFDVNITGSEPLPFVTVPDLSNNRIAKRVDMSPLHFKCLTDFYEDTYELDQPILVSKVIKKFSTIRLHGKVYNSAESRTQKGTNIQFLFLSQYGTAPEAWPGKILYFFKHEQKTGSNTGVKTAHIFAFIRFYSSYGNNNSRKYETNGLEVWNSQYAPLSRDCIVPIQRIFSQVAVAKKKIRRRTESASNSDSFPLIVIPLQRSVHG